LKKSWHPARIQNVEKVWKAEQEAIAEKQRIMELQRKLQEERQIEELKRLSQASSSKSKPRAQRLDWMYEGGVKVTTAQEYLEGKPYEEPKEEAPKEHLGLFQNQQLSADQDTWNRLREDPLLEMKRQEQKSLDYIKQNPVKMAMIKRKLYEMEKQEKEEKRRKHGKDKMEKKHRHHGDKKDKKEEKETDKKEESKVIKTGYGLVYPKGVPTDKKQEDAPKVEAKDFETIRKEKRLEKHREWEERDKEASRKREERRQRHQQFRNLSSDERKRKLEEMQADADVNEQRRDSRLKRHRATEEKRDEEDSKKGDVAANFLNDLKKKTYSKAGVATLEERLTRNVHFRYKGDLEEADTFKTK